MTRIYKRLPIKLYSPATLREIVISLVAAMRGNSCMDRHANLYIKLNQLTDSVSL